MDFVAEWKRDVFCSHLKKNAEMNLFFWRLGINPIMFRPGLSLNYLKSAPLKMRSFQL